MARYRRITIEWSYPVEISSILQKDCMNDIGIYYISRKFGNNESMLYIGKTTDKFFNRLESHSIYKIDKYRGEKYVRLGRIVSPKNISEEDLKDLINDAEKTIIFYVSNLCDFELIDNVDCRYRISFNNKLKITNTGYRGKLPKELFIPEDMLYDD